MSELRESAMTIKTITDNTLDFLPLLGDQVSQSMLTTGGLMLLSLVAVLWYVKPEATIGRKAVSMKQLEPLQAPDPRCEICKAVAELVTPQVKERFYRLNRVRNGEAAIDVYQPVPVGYVRDQQYAIQLLTMQIAEDHSELADFASRVIELIGGE